MDTFLQISFWVNFLLFFLFIFLIFFIPGDLFISRLKLSTLLRITLATIFGIVLWAFQGLLFGFLNLRFLTYLYIIIATIFWARNNYQQLKFSNTKSLLHNKYDRLLIGICFVGIVTQLSAVWFIGTKTARGLYFCCRSVPDTIYHLSLTNALVHHMPPFEPGMSGTTVHNYHYLSNLVVADFVRITNLPLFQTQYQFFSLLLAIITALSAISFVQLLEVKKSITRWFVFFLFFSGDILYIFTFFLKKQFNFDITILDDASKMLTGPPRAFSLVIFFSGLSLFFIWIKKKNTYVGILAMILFASLVGFKIYVAIFAFSGLFAISCYFIFKRKFRMLLPIIIGVAIAAGLYFPINTHSSGLYFSGMWRLDDFFVHPGIDLTNLVFAREALVAHHNIPKVVFLTLVFFIVYILSLFGTIGIGFSQTKKSLQLLPKEINIFLLSAIFVTGFFGFFTLQQVGGANTIQFLIFIIMIGSLYAALVCSYWIKKVRPPLKYAIIAIIVLLTIPRVLHESGQNIQKISREEGFLINNQKLEALAYLKKNTDTNAIVIADPAAFSSENESLYVSFLADRPVFLAGEGILQDHGLNINMRKKDQELIFYGTDVAGILQTLMRKKIDYVYTTPKSELLKHLSSNLVRVFGDKEVVVLQVKK